MIEAAWADVHANLWLYLSMPFTSGVIGYITNVQAVRMMFYPVEFLGVPPWLGWQGIIPRKCRKIATIACDTMVPRLISEREIFGRLVPQRVADELRPATSELARELTDEVMRGMAPNLWESAPSAWRENVSGAGGGSSSVVARVMQDIQAQIDRIFDLKTMVVDLLSRDKPLINRIFLETGKKEFKFIEISGFYFGFLFGIFQMLGWAFYKGQWQLPFFGLVVGYATNWLALWMIFKPRQPWRFGPWTLQGLFHKRQKEVARDYSRLVAGEVITPSHIVESVLKSPSAHLIHEMVDRHLRQALDARAGRLLPLARLWLGTTRLEEIRILLTKRIVAQLPRLMLGVDAYAVEAMDLAETIRLRLQDLPPDEFEAMLRPAFKEDEWILIAVGAVLGFLVGLGQMILFKLLAKKAVVAAVLSTGVWG